MAHSARRQKENSFQILLSQLPIHLISEDNSDLMFVGQHLGYFTRYILYHYINMLVKKIHQCLFSTVLWKYSGKCWKKQAFLFLSSFSKSSWVTKQLCIQILSIIFQEGSGNDYRSEPRGVKQDQTCESPNHSEILMRQWFIFYCNPTFWLLVVISDRMALTNMFSLPWSIILSPEGKAVYCGPLFKPRTSLQEPSRHRLLPSVFQYSTLRNRTAESNQLFLCQYVLFHMICTPEHHTPSNSP